MEDTTYLFIDGGYLDRLYQDTVHALFGHQWRIDFSQMTGVLHPRKSFYYDCLDEKHTDETEEAFEGRKKEQSEYFEAIRSVKGMHVRLGKLVGTGRKRRQKEVDVQLAVDMLNHAYRHNMTKAILIAGDRDYRPLVESLVQIGTFIEVQCGRTGSKELIRAADHHEIINVQSLCRWTVQGLQFPNETHSGGSRDPYFNAGWQRRKTGKTATGGVILYSHPQDESLFSFSVQRRSSWTAYQFGDLSLLERFIGMQFGPIEWD